MRRRLAPSADRMATSFWRPAARTSIRVSASDEQDKRNRTQKHQEEVADIGHSSFVEREHGNPVLLVRIGIFLSERACNRCHISPSLGEVDSRFEPGDNLYARVPGP